MQNNGAGVCSEVNAYASQETDDFFVVNWPEKSQKEYSTCRMNVVVSVAGFAL